MTPIFLLVGILGMTSLVLTAQAQVEVKQSTTVNGQTTSVTTTDNKKAIIKIQGAILEITSGLQTFKIKLCDDNDKHCHPYLGFKNGTISEVK